MSRKWRGSEWCNGDCAWHKGACWPKAGCDRGNFLCADKKQCINNAYICDGEADCDDSSDELNCGLARWNFYENTNCYKNRGAERVGKNAVSGGVSMEQCRHSCIKHGTGCVGVVYRSSDRHCFRLKSINVGSCEKGGWANGHNLYQIKGKTASDPCKPNPCKNSASCSNGKCNCPEGLGGDFCEITGTLVNCGGTQWERFCKLCGDSNNCGGDCYWRSFWGVRGCNKKG